MELQLAIIVSGITKGMIYGLVAMGFVIIYKCSSVLNLAQGAMVLIGAYIGWTFAYHLHLPLWLVIIISLTIAAGIGLLIERLVMRPLLGESILVMITITIALEQILFGGTLAGWGAADLLYVEIIPSGAISLGVVSMATEHAIAIVVAAALLIAFVFFFRYSRWGLAMRGVAEGHQVARSMGISVKFILALSWAFAAMLATLGGILYGSLSGFRQGLHEIGLMSIPAAFIGGLDSVHGAIVGGIIVGVAESYANQYILPGYAFGRPLAFLLLVVVMLWRPYGLWGRVRIERV